MRTQFAAEVLRCPVCRSDRTLTLHAEVQDEREVREGSLQCGVCGRVFPVQRGVAELLVDPPEHVQREADGLERFAAQMRGEGWGPERILALPNIEDGYWFVQAVGMHQLLREMDFRPGQTLVDVGSNTCWAANTFAAEELNVVALDIATVELQGLYTADIFFAHGGPHFERVLGTMNEMPFASGSMDYVYCCEVLHHNDRQGLRRTIAEAHRVLKPGGRLLVLNETLKTLRDPHGVHVDHVAHLDGYEHAHWAFQYRLEAMRAGFRTRLVWPDYSPPRSVAGRGLAARVGYRIERQAMRTRGTRRAGLVWLNHIAGGVQFSMVATKRH